MQNPNNMIAWKTPLQKYVDTTGESAEVHRGSVERAIARGEQVGLNVLLDYPELVDNTNPLRGMVVIQTAIAKMYRDEADSQSTTVAIAGLVSKESLAEFIVDAFNRGWISKFNLGIDDDGKVI